MNVTGTMWIVVAAGSLAGLAWLAAPAVVAAAVPADAASSVVSSPAPAATSGTPAALTLEQAVARVRAKTHGKVLRASSRMYGDMTQYRIKVLTPDGHVRVIPVRSRPTPTPENEPEENH